MATEVLMPKLGLTMTEGTIEEWKFSCHNFCPSFMNLPKNRL